MSGRFHYRGYLVEPSPADPGRVAYRPMLSIWCYGRTRGVEVVALVDTGAAITLLPMELWTLGEIDPTFVAGDEEELEAANGSRMLVKYGTINLQLTLGDDVYYWAAKVGFSEDRDEAVLGDVGFLRYFKALFDRHGRVLTIGRSGELPPPFVPGRDDPSSSGPRRRSPAS